MKGWGELHLLQCSSQKCSPAATVHHLHDMRNYYSMISELLLIKN